MIDVGSLPGYWRNETSGVLVPVVERFLHGEDLDAEGIATMRAYLRQWVYAPGFVGSDIERLRWLVDRIDTMVSLRAWLHVALQAGIDPL